MARMTEDRLRRWVRDELPPDERREVSRWIVGCTAPELGPLLSGLVAELTDERANAQLTTRGGVWARLVDRWHALLDRGSAHISTGHGAGLVLATTDGVAHREPLVVTGGEASPQIEFRPRGPTGEIALYLTDDDARCFRLYGPVASADATVALPGARGPRPVVWGVNAPALPRDVDPAVELDRACNQPDAVVWAVRYEPDV